MRDGIKTLMAPIDGDYPGDESLRAVGRLASELGARIVGISACTHPPSMYFEAGVIAQEAYEEDERRLNERMREAERRFRAALAGFSGHVQWRSTVEIPLGYVAREARVADMIVAFPRRDGRLLDCGDAGEIVLNAGRPVLAVPQGTECRLPRKVMIAWKETREARRAVADALPLLTRAAEVSVVEVLEGEESRRSAETRLRDVAAWLEMHGVSCTWRVPHEQGDAVASLVSAASGFDLVVAGAYGHSRIGEWIFGGVTRHLLTKSPFTVFLSH